MAAGVARLQYLTTRSLIDTPSRIVEREGKRSRDVEMIQIGRVRLRDNCAVGGFQ